VIGVTTVHEPHTFMGEGIADAVAYFFPEEVPLSAYGQLALVRHVWRDYLNNNAHILVNMGWDEQMLLDYLLQNPFTTPERARFDLERWRTHPLLRAYQYAYGIATKYHQVFLRQMSRTQRVQYLRYGFRRYVTPARLIAEAQRIVATGEDRDHRAGIRAPSTPQPH
jgi:hypothetical protein